MNWKVMVAFLGVFLINSCARVKKLSPEEEARLAAADAIQKAEEFIKQCEEEEIDVSEAKTLLDEAKDYFNEANWKMAKEKADRSFKLAEKLRNEALEARKKLMEEAQSRMEEKLPSSYTVGTWEKDRDCLWNIAKKSEIYNDPWQWKKIYFANRDKIKDPDLIYPGQVFKIPR
ncbi:MAG: LysM peptidoglycan-binding domain-containing protein [Elusimicrobia bacterium]|nr:LysM peptidoglycan-binding domain-containing protein [Elusimicrobiota bacterium]